MLNPENETAFLGRVLIVDDDPFNMNLLVNLMKKAGIQPLVATDGLEALELLKNTEPDVILLDIMMPEMDGFEVCRRLKANPKTAYIPVLFMSALKGIEQKMEGFKLGGADYITKPFRKEEVVARVRTHMTLQQQKRELRDVQTRYKELFENMSSGVAVYEPQDGGKRFIFKDINRTGEIISGVPREQLIDRDVEEIFPTIQDVGLLKIFQRVFATGEPVRQSALRFEEKGREYWVENFVYKLPSGEIVAVYDDVTRSHQAREALKKSLEKIRWGKRLLEKTYNSLKSAVFIIDARTSTILECNHAVETIFGYGRKELIGHGRSKLFLSDHHYQKFRERSVDSFAQQGFFKIRDYEMKRKDGQIFPTDHTVTPLHDDERNVICWVSVIQDMTEQKKLEERLRQSQKMEAVGTLAGGIAHDFNNILFPIIGYTEMTFDELPQGSRGRKNLAQILKATDRAKDLVAQILTFSRKNIAELGPIRIQPIVKESLKLLRSTIPTTIEIRQKIDETGPVLADPTQIHQVLINLCTNAYHAMRETGGLLEVRLDQVHKELIDIKNHPAASAPEYIRITIKDTGCGMSETVLKQIFDPYFTTKGMGEGTGLGLSVVDGIIKEHRGFITAETELGIGSRFAVFLPLIGDEDAGEPEENIIIEPILYGREHILVVDDEESIGTMLRRMLEGLGYKVTIRYSSPDALAAFQRGPGQFDLVITDMTMPNMTGMELSGKLLDIRPDIPIILTTGFSEMVDEETAKAAGIREYLLKPIIKQKLSAAIRKALA